MPPEKRQKKASPPSEDGSAAAAKPYSNDGTPVGAALDKDNAPSQELLALAGDKSCPGICCQKGDDWVRSHLTLEEFPRGLGTTGLDTYAWLPVSSGVQELAIYVRNRGLAPWAELPPAVREKMGLWSPVAQQLWGSDFDSHQEALVRAWIWHYLDDNPLSFSGDVPSAEYPSCASQVWDHVRALRHELDVLRSGHQDLDRWTQERYCLQYHFWRRLTDALVREGLGLQEFATPADLIPHFRTSLRSLVANGETAIPDHPFESQWHLIDDVGDSADELNDEMLRLLKNTMTLQRYQHGMIASCRLRFTPIGSDSPWGFPVDKESMDEFDPPEIPRRRPSEPLPLVQLVSDPMLVISGMNGWGYENDIKPWPKSRLVVVAPWTFGGEEAEKHTFPGFEKGWRERMTKRVEEEIKREEAAERAEAARQLRPRRTKDTTKEEEEEEEKDGQNPGCSVNEREKKGKKRAIAKQPVKGVKGKKVAKRKK